jgi:glycosyltransferase involved in cell wall biosynthesis
LAERKAVKFSDKRICLSERDSRLLKKLYGQGATHIAPMVLEDKCPASFMQVSAQVPERFALFVGGTFYANRAGIAWFVREVVPRIDLPVYIVGRGFETLRAELEVPGKVIVVGAVDCLADWYHRAQFVIAPIFDGSGMKTKVAEALMYGKKIVGTPEAFSGYENVVEQAGWLCDTADEFSRAINAASKEISTSFNPVLRNIYEQRYSMAAAQERLRQVLT